MGPPLISGGNASALRGKIRRADASMGPPLISGGNLTKRPHSEGDGNRFNGAAADQRRKWADKVVQQLAKQTLQWGRR